MNNKDFERNFISILNLLGVTDYPDRVYIVTPVIEENKKHNEFDDMIKHFGIPQIRKLTFNEFIKLFTLKEGYYPCWIEIINVDTDIIINTSVRMRKLKETKCIGKYHPFYSELINKIKD